MLMKRRNNDLPNLVSPEASLAVAEIRTRYGCMTVPGMADDVIGLRLHQHGEWGWNETSFLASVLPDGTRVLDVGGFVGTFGLGLCLSRNLSFLCVVEANPLLLPALQANLRRNASCEVAVVSAMVGGPGTTPRAGRSHSSNLGSTSFQADATGEIATPLAERAVTLAELREEYGPFHLVKLDVEGMEQEILEGDAEYLARGDTTLWLECCEQPGSLKLAETLLGLGLEVFYFAFPAHNPDNIRGRSGAVFPLAFEAGLLAAPRSAPQLSPVLAAHGCILRPIWSAADLKDAMWRTPRWGYQGWDSATHDELAALAAHELLGERYDIYLMPNWRRGRPLQVRLVETEAEAAAALAELDAARAAHATAVEAHAAAEKAAADHATALQASQTELQRREATLLQQNDELAALRGQHAALEQAASRQDRLEAALAEVERTLQPRTRALAAEATEAERCRAAFGRSSAVALDRLELLAETRRRAEAAEAIAQSAEQMLAAQRAAQMLAEAATRPPPNEVATSPLGPDPTVSDHRIPHVATVAAPSPRRSPLTRLAGDFLLTFRQRKRA